MVVDVEKVVVVGVGQRGPNVPVNIRLSVVPTARWACATVIFAGKRHYQNYHESLEIPLNSAGLCSGMSAIAIAVGAAIMPCNVTVSVLCGRAAWGNFGTEG